MEEDVRPTPDSVYGRCLPGLEAIPTVKIMQRLPEVEDCVGVRTGVGTEEKEQEVPSSQS